MGPTLPQLGLPLAFLARVERAKVEVEMTVYAVGDVQGCYEPLQRLLQQVAFEPARDRLWFVGDLVNRGPSSLEVLRFARALGDAARLVLGNHDLHLIQIADGVRSPKAGDTLQAVLDAPDGADLIAWLRTMPLVYHEAELGYCMVHAGLPPQWDLTEALARAREAEGWIASAGWSAAEARSGARADIRAWHPALAGAERMRTILDYFTRMRFCDANGRLELAANGPAEQPPVGYLPWFAHPARKTRAVRIVFGHWAALDGRAQADNVYALDTGCVWGRTLTFMRLPDGRRFDCSCASARARKAGHVDES
jgi:bis(5'-nucleosyl)-tetraphosphatase (symmetrical)